MIDIIEFKGIEEKDYFKLTALIEKLADESNFYP